MDGNEDFTESDCNLDYLYMGIGIGVGGCLVLVLIISMICYCIIRASGYRCQKKENALEEDYKTDATSVTTVV